jgi:ArsR family transcriptional regulator
MQNALRQYKARIFQALSHPTRVGMVEQLRDRELSVAQLCDYLSIEQANASQHLAVLRNNRMVLTRKEGNQVFYRLRCETMGRLLDVLREFFSSHLEEAFDVLRAAKAEESVEPAAAE